jgi:hypothetical protein
VRVVAGRPQDADDLLDVGRIGGIAMTQDQPSVASVSERWRRQREIASIHFLHPLNEPPTDLMGPFIAEPAHAETTPL